MDRFPEGAILITIDVVGPYPNIPHDEGLEALRKILNTRTNQEIPTDDIVDLAELVLKNNKFEFDGKYFLQKRGTSIGTRLEWRLPMLIYSCPALNHSYWTWLQ